MKVINGQEVLEDGESLSVAVRFMDGKSASLIDEIARQALRPAYHDGLGHRAGSAPGYVFPANVSDAQQKAQEAWERRGALLSDAWKNAPPLEAGPTKDATPPPTLSPAEARAAADAAYDARGKQLEDAWRKP